jgi:hypothetical protein
VNHLFDQIETAAIGTTSRAKIGNMHGGTPPLLESHALPGLCGISITSSLPPIFAEIR